MKFRTWLGATSGQSSLVIVPKSVRTLAVWSWSVQSYVFSGFWTHSGPDPWGQSGLRMIDHSPRLPLEYLFHAIIVTGLGLRMCFVFFIPAHFPGFPISHCRLLFDPGLDQSPSASGHGFGNLGRR